MVSAENIKGYIAAAIVCEHIEVRGDGQHWEAVIVSREFEAKNKVQQHQLVYRALGGRMGGELHALQLETSVPSGDHE